MADYEHTKEPLISIIITTYNAEKYLKECIQSVQFQTMKDYEMVCIDGNSIDNTCEIIKQMMENDSRLNLYQQTRPGIGAAKNNGIEFSKGKFITFLDADDLYVDPTALERMYNACKEYDVKICGAFRTIINRDGKIEKMPLHRKDCRNKSKGIMLDYVEKQYDYHFHSYIYEREMIIKSNARFGEVSAYDDTHFFIRAMLEAKKFCVVPVELYRYRCGPEYEWGPKKALDAMDMLIDQLIITEKNGLAKLHWITVQRVNYEYCRIICDNIKNGCRELMDKLIEANGIVSTEMIDYVQNNNLIDRDYLISMMDRPLSETISYINTDKKYDTKYILEPLWILDHGEREKVKKNIFKRGLICLKDHGLIYTIKCFFRMKR